MLPLFLPNSLAPFQDPAIFPSDVVRRVMCLLPVVLSVMFVVRIPSVTVGKSVHNT